MNILDVVSLDDNKDYIVGAKTKYRDINYYCLMNKEKIDDVIICKSIDNNLLQEESDAKIIRELMPLFYKSIDKEKLMEQLK